MKIDPTKKYNAFPLVDLPDREWPNRRTDTAPTWCSVDLRDGNQALAVPMNVEQKLELFQLLVDIGFKEIEVGFPSASQIEFDFIRRLIDENLIPADVTVQVLTQAREHLIRKSFEAIKGTKRAVVHLYNSTSPAQRKITFGMEKSEIKAIAEEGARLIKELCATVPETEVVLEYSPESFSQTELEFSLEVCEAVCAIWAPTPERKIILNLPATVEAATPNIHADQIEWFRKNLSCIDSAIISLHTHNDRGTGVAASELGMMAGATRVEGTLFGNGERTGNVDIVTLALNMFSQGVDPKLDLDDVPAIREVYERCTRMNVHERHPYAGDLVFTAFSGSHQDAINKGMMKVAEEKQELWEVPYLPIDPQDIGRTYEAIIRINSQSGKGGVAYVMEQEFGFQLPKQMHLEFGPIINALADKRGAEIAAEDMYAEFERTYLDLNTPYELISFDVTQRDKEKKEVEAEIVFNVSGKTKTFTGRGNGPIDALIRGIKDNVTSGFTLKAYSEHSLSVGAESNAVAYIQLENEAGRSCFGAGIDSDIETASLKAVVSALNRFVNA